MPCAIRKPDSRRRTPSTPRSEPRARISVLDLADLDSVRSFVAREEAGRIDILINNGGVMASPEPRTKQGSESTIGINHLGHFLMTVGLVPALERSPEARLVVVSSGGHWWGPFDFDDWNYEKRPLDPTKSYSESKTANALFVVESDRRYRSRGIYANAVAPLVNTTMGRHLTADDNKRLGMTPEVRAMGKTPEHGAASVVWAATGPELAHRGGLYLEDGREIGVGIMDKPPRSFCCRAAPIRAPITICMCPGDRGTARPHISRPPAWACWPSTISAPAKARPRETEAA